MARADQLLSTIEAVHAAGLDDALWPRALGAVTQLLNGACATLEVIGKPNLDHRAFHGFNVPPIDELTYVRDYAAMSPRIPFAARLKSGAVISDYQILDERGIDLDPFYSQFLAQVDVRYFIAAIIDSSDREFTSLSIQRTRKRGHVGGRERALMQRLLPHVRQAYDVTARLKAARGAAHDLAQALGWLTDGVALLRRDGRICYANDAFHAIACRGDGMRVVRGTIEFADAVARASFAATLGAMGRAAEGDAKGAGHDFFAPRTADAHPYVVSMRPVPASRQETGDAIAIVFVCDPHGGRANQGGLLGEAFGLTEAEASLAQALQAGATLEDHARARGISLNTVYTHLRRIKEKTGCSRLSQLIQKLNDLRIPARRG